MGAKNIREMKNKGKILGVGVTYRSLQADLKATVLSPRNQALSWKEVCAQHMFSDFRQVEKKELGLLLLSELFFF